MVLSNGNSIDTKSWNNPGSLSSFGGGQLETSEGQYKPQLCHFLILIRRQLSVTHQGYEYRTLDHTSPVKAYGSDNDKCQAEFLALPFGWEISPDTTTIRQHVIAAYPWGTHVARFGTTKFDQNIYTHIRF